MDALKRFRLATSHLIPDYDLQEPSLQKCLVAALDKKRSYLKASENLTIQHETSKMLAFRYQAEKIFGENWKDETDFATALQKWMLGGIPPEIQVADLLIGEIESFSKAVELVETYQSNASQGDEWKPEFQKPLTHEMLILNWTNPNAPLWLMNNESISKVVGERILRSTSVSTTIERLGLKRLKHMPIQGVDSGEDPSNADILLFRFSCASYVKGSPGLPEFLECCIERKRFEFSSNHFLEPDD